MVSLPSCLGSRFICRRFDDGPDYVVYDTATGDTHLLDRASELIALSRFAPGLTLEQRIESVARQLGSPRTPEFDAAFAQVDAELQRWLARG